MPTVYYHQVLERVIPVEITDAQLHALQLCNNQFANPPVVLSELEQRVQSEAQQFVTDTALEHQHEYPLEFQMATVLDDEGEELYDL